MKDSIIAILIVFCGIGATAQPAAITGKGQVKPTGASGADSMGKARGKIPPA